MKILLTALLALSIILISCSDSSTNTNNLTQGTLKASIDGTAWNALMGIAAKTSIVVAISGTKSINNNAGTETLSIIIANSAETSGNKATATFVVMPDKNNQETSETWVASEVNYSISSMTSTDIKGTFSCTLKNGTAQKQVTDGAFYCKFAN